MGRLMYIACCALGSAGSAMADEMKPEAPLEELVVVGSRAAPRSSADTAAPVDVFSQDLLRDQPQPDLSRALQFLAPSFNFPRSATAPSAANTRAITLRGLAPDQVLVLVNGKRRHASSVMNFNNVVGRGSVPVDLNTLPLSAVERVEILRDGAAAQYGSDAIAGVINIVLRSDTRTGAASIQSGATEDGDGENAALSGYQGWSIGDSGFFSLAGEVRYRDFTNGAGLDSRFGRITNRQGDPQSTDINLIANGEYALENGVQTYAFLTAAHRDSESAAQYRAPSVSPLYPTGFIPLIDLDMDDFGATLGARGEWAGWQWDLSDTLGYNRADFMVDDSVNTSLGASSPVKFDAGGARYAQNLASLSAARLFDRVLSGLNVAAGLETRHEQFRLAPGESSSFVGAGAQGFPGFNPPQTVDERRHAWSAYLDLELKPKDWLTFGAAARHEDYSDFGDKTIGKLSVHTRVNPALALRATTGAGFRAPSLQQQYFSTVTSQSSAGVLVNVGTFAVNDPVSLALGASPLRPETSRQWTAGLILTPIKALTLSADYFNIDIDDRIALSESLSGAAVAAVLSAQGITNVREVRFFTNAADTRTRGYEITALWSTAPWSSAALDLSLGFMSVDSRLDTLRSNPVLPSLPLLAPRSIDLLTESQPRNKVTASARLDARQWHALIDVARFGSYRSFAVLSEQTFSAKTTIDAALSYDLTQLLTFSLGVINATDTYPDQMFDRSLSQGGSLQYPEAGALGVDGREYYGRFVARW